MSPSAPSRQAARGSLVRLAVGVYLVPELLDDRSHLAAVQLRCPQALASHRAAAMLHGLDGIDRDVVEVTVPRDVRLRGPFVHRSADVVPFDVTEVDGTRCTDPTRTLRDLGAVVTGRALELAVESALRKGLTSVPRPRWRADGLARPGRPGPRELRRLLDGRTDGPATERELEVRFLQCIRGHLPEPERQVRAGSARVDVGWPAALVSVELDSWRWHSDRTAFQHDRTRQNGVVVAGWTVLRFTWDDVVHRPRYVIATCRAALVAASAAQRQ